MVPKNGDQLPAEVSNFQLGKIIHNIRSVRSTLPHERLIQLSKLGMI